MVTREIKWKMEKQRSKMKGEFFRAPIHSLLTTEGHPFLYALCLFSTSTHMECHQIFITCEPLTSFFLSSLNQLPNILVIYLPNKILSFYIQFIHIKAYILYTLYHSFKLQLNYQHSYNIFYQNFTIKCIWKKVIVK